MIEIMKKDSLKKGLSGEQAAKSKAEFGTNELAKKQPESLLSMFIGAFDDIWIKVLCFALLLKIVLAVLGVIFPAISGGNRCNRNREYHSCNSTCNGLFNIVGVQKQFKK